MPERTLPGRVRQDARNVPSTARCPNGLFQIKYGKMPEIERILLCLATRHCSLATRHCSRRCAELSLTAVLLAGGTAYRCKRPRVACASRALAVLCLDSDIFDRRALEGVRRRRHVLTRTCSTVFVLSRSLKTTRSSSVLFGIASLRQFDLLNGRAPLAATFNSRLS